MDDAYRTGRSIDRPSKEIGGHQRVVAYPPLDHLRGVGWRGIGGDGVQAARDQVRCVPDEDHDRESIHVVSVRGR